MNNQLHNHINPVISMFHGTSPVYYMLRSIGKKEKVNIFEKKRMSSRR